MSLSIPLLDLFYSNDLEVCNSSRQLLPCSAKNSAKKVLKMGKKCFTMTTTRGAFSLWAETKLISSWKSLSGNGLDWFTCLLANAIQVGVGKANTEESLYCTPVAPQVTQHEKWQIVPAYKRKYPCELLHAHNGTYLDSSPQTSNVWGARSSSLQRIYNGSAGDQAAFGCNMTTDPNSAWMLQRKVFAPTLKGVLPYAFCAKIKC